MLDKINGLALYCLKNLGKGLPKLIIEDRKMKYRSISMKAVSEITGVSIATVSRVINNNGRFSKDTRERVLSAINENGYIPNALAQGLRKSRMQNIGIIVPDITNEFFAKMALYIQQTLFEMNYSTLIYNTDENIVLETRHLQNLVAQNVSAIVFIAGGGNPQFDVNKFSVPMIFLDRTPPRTREIVDYISIHTDNFEGGYLAGKEMVKGNCRKPAVVMDERKMSNQLDRLNGFKKALSETNIQIKPEAIFKVPRVNCEAAYKVTCDFINKGKSYDSYFCTTDLLAIGTMTALIENNVSIPKQVRIIGYDDVSIANYCSVPLTTIHQDIKGMSDLAVKLLLDILNGINPDKQEFIFDPVLVKRQSA